GCKGGFCTQNYSCSSTCYRKSTYYTSCGFLWLSRCTKYRSISYTCYKDCSRSVCCTGYTGRLCTQATCFGSTSCPNGGTCIAPNTCICRTGYSGTNCSAICFGSTSCPNGGTCIAPNNCSCRIGYSGINC
ncbi:WIF1-like protein, partial [Mya arenaria]